MRLIVDASAAADVEGAEPAHFPEEVRMKKLVRLAAAISMIAVLVGVSGLVTAGGKRTPPPPDLCGCLCPDGSVVVAHAPQGTSCEDACPSIVATFCASDM
jgi:hypothetical protein